jgi:hypothetical protein
MHGSDQKYKFWWENTDLILWDDQQSVHYMKPDLIISLKLFLRNRRAKGASPFASGGQLCSCVGSMAS